MISDKQDQELQQQRVRFENAAAQHVAQQATAERSFWSWLKRVPMKKEIIPPGGVDNPEFLEKIKPFLRPGEKQIQFVARTMIGPVDAARLSRKEIGELIAARHADKESSIGPAEVFEPRPMPRRIILDVDNF